jgi:hypothetical protein
MSPTTLGRTRPTALAARALLFSMFSLAAVPANAQGLEVASAKSYKGTEGQYVDVLTLKPVAQNSALVRVRSSGSPFDGLVLPCSIEPRDRNERGFVTRFHGGALGLLRLGDGAGRVYFPEVRDFAVKFDEAATAKLEPAKVLAAHQQQRAAGELAMFEKREYPNLVAKYEAKAAAATDELNRACGTSARFSFRWSSFTDADMDDVDGWSACQPLLTLLKSRCAAAKGLSKLVCQMGPKLELTRGADGTLTFTTTAKGQAEGPAFLSTQLGK